MSKSFPILRPADHVFIDCQAYSHHGILIAENRVVHFDSTPMRKMLGRANGQPPEIREISLEEFAADKILHVREYEGHTLSIEETIERATRRIGEQGYDLCDNNCEHFAVWCKTGISHSSQVESAQRVAKTGAASVAVSTAVFRTARFLPLPYRVAAYTAGAALAIGSTTYQYLSEKQKNRKRKTS